ncbi:MAG: hypothetical protein ABIP91_00325 [Sphingomicrobium sp.]
MKAFALIPAGLLMSGCVIGTIARTAVDVATLPVKVAGHAVDAATTSQAEADANAGRAARRADERLGRELRALAERCRKRQTLPSDDCRRVQPR